MSYTQSGGFVVGKTLNNGYPGNISRSADAIITNRPVRSTDTASIPFGAPVVLNGNNTYSLFGASNVAADFAGVAIREVQQATTYFPATGGSYAPGQPCDVAERGSLTVNCTEGTPASGGAVYIVTVAGTGAVSAVGDFIAIATPAGTSSAAVEVTNAQWKSVGVDANGVAELTILSRNKA